MVLGLFLHFVGNAPDLIKLRAHLHGAAQGLAERSCLEYLPLVKTLIATVHATPTVNTSFTLHRLDCRNGVVNCTM